MENSLQNLSTDWQRIFIYKAESSDGVIDVDDSVYIGFRLTDICFTDLGYDSDSQTSGVLLLESIQNLKFRIQGARFKFTAMCNFDFDGLYNSSTDQT